MKGAEGRAKQPSRERRLKAGKMLQWSILSESPSSYAAKVGEAEEAERQRAMELPTAKPERQKNKKNVIFS